MRGASRIGAGLVLGSGLGLAASCQPTSFACESDLGCAGLPDGRCEPSGYCSVPDQECDSGHRYAPHSGGLSEQCVEAGATGTGSTTAVSSSDETTLELDGTTVSPPDPDLGGSSETDTGPPVMQCPGTLLIDEPFDEFPPHPSWWNLYENAGLEPSVIDGELYLEAVEAISAYTGIETAIALPAVGFATVELSTAPSSDAPAQAYLVIGADFYYGFFVEQDTLYTFEEGADSLDRTINPYDPVEHRWLRLLFDADQRTLTWETSPDGIEWKQLDAEDQLDDAFDLTTAAIDLGAGVWDGPYSADPLATFEQALLCAL